MLTNKTWPEPKKKSIIKVKKAFKSRLEIKNVKNDKWLSRWMHVIKLNSLIKLINYSYKC